MRFAAAAAIALTCILLAWLAAPAGEGTTTRPAFQPNPKLADLADNTVMDLGAFTWERPAGEGAIGSVTDYSGMTNDPHNHRILLFGGGHATTFTDAIYAFTFPDLTWRCLYTPTPAKLYKKDNMDRGFWKAGETGDYPRPVGRHTYDLLAVPDDRQELLLLMNGGGPSSVAPGIGYWGGAAGRYDFKTGRWTMLPKTPFGGYGGVAEYDPLSKQVVGTLGQVVDAYDPADGKVTPIARNISDRLKVSGYSGTMVYFPPDKRMYVIPADKKVWILDLDRTDLARSKIVVPTVKGTCPAGECGFAYDAANHVIGGGVKNNRFYVFDPARMEWTSQEMQGGKPGTMTFHCIAYDPVNNVYVFLAGRRTWAYRYKAVQHGRANASRPAAGSGTSSNSSGTVLKSGWTRGTSPGSGPWPTAGIRAPRESLTIPTASSSG